MSQNPQITDDENDWCEHLSFRENESLDHDSIPPRDTDVPQEDSSYQSNQSVYMEMPPQLHPACSIGFQRVSSCYFSIASANHSESSMVVSQLGDSLSHEIDLGGTHELSMPKEYQGETDPSTTTTIEGSVDLFYHDILMQVFTFLDAKSLLSFSETARRPNFEVFYFLQLQLQRALVLDKNGFGPIENENDRSLSTAEGSSSIVSRVARTNMERAREIVQEYQDSNSTLKTMPLSYSLAYVRHYLLRNGFHKVFPDQTGNSSSRPMPGQTLASAAIFMTVVGAASLVSSSSDASTIAATMTDKFGSELPNALFRLGFVGSLVRAISDTERGTAMREKAEQMARAVPLLQSALISDKKSEEQDRDGSKSTIDTTRKHYALPSFFEMRHMLQEMMSRSVGKESETQPLLFGPYDHLISEEEETKSFGDDDTRRTKKDSNNKRGRKIPSGCVGAYSRAIGKASACITEQVRESRKSAFEALSPELQRTRAVRLLNACASNDTLEDVKGMISEIDVNRFYVGSDATETCALHTAAFHGADKVVEFLCAGIDHQDPQKDGGLCDVNAKDNNGWTALHFAAGANSIEAVRVLAHHGALLDVEAHNGYTPFSWAIRLSNDALADELQALMKSGASDHSGTWIPRQPLTSIANRFLSLIPTQ